MNFMIFRKNVAVSWPGFYRVFCPGASKSAISMFSVGFKKMRDKKLCRFVVVSLREVPYSTVSCSFKIFIFRLFLRGPPFGLFQFREFSAH